MAVKTFTTGEVLTASDTNTYLANSGLVYVAGGALSTNITPFAGCFTSTYRNYVVKLDNVKVSGAANFWFQYLNGSTPKTTNYYWDYMGYTTVGTTLNTYTNGGASTGYTGMDMLAGVPGSCTLDIFDPAVSVQTVAISTSYFYKTNWTYRTGASHQDDVTTFDGIRFLTDSAVTMTGNVAIYGYRMG